MKMGMPRMWSTDFKDALYCVVARDADVKEPHIVVGAGRVSHGLCHCMIKPYIVMCTAL